MHKIIITTPLNKIKGFKIMVSGGLNESHVHLYILPQSNQTGLYFIHLDLIAPK
jgi:hypothetical protein